MGTDTDVNQMLPSPLANCVSDLPDVSTFIDAEGKIPMSSSVGRR